uniref:Ribosome-binding factor A n=1 Tax=Eucampia antarctica TaxID=49252 RepID=A0A7S2WSD9_9STRA|mmetsp:Transcript_9844/g.9516  ORF Transcript_9844/g.9516 Transcript_9844/m.9516 type:complete len:258 (+) Transcript_9844:59-832(+)|eukprot:CAMPEP_0197825152 /NCGR_PEP_ID=MMETSP1437-20131217/2286_1 /TAXON_ID=49252 ORGANISM="Eucampia antarctica, Strain CCMP1452" /NCGR_SAMPLE_ID=MMETSP1437 /ASSEMBLY_ACC=CAM_ASM_001096 /LENGTH=257 /DNA_ID=CAMNT_0043425037 /DNA_START=59 /DNA_END=832 /DNA_ORIENTATION=-
MVLMGFRLRVCLVLLATTFSTIVLVNSFQLQKFDVTNRKHLTALEGYGGGRSSNRYTSNQDRSKRQERVGHVVRTEIASIIQQGFSIKYADFIDDDLRRRINIVNANVSPDLRQARITVSIIAATKTKPTDSESDDEDLEEGEQIFASDITVDQRRAYSWLVRSTRMIRHSMAQRLSHMKTIPDLTFVQADVGAAVDVMKLIEKVNQGYKRENIGTFGGGDDSLPEGMYLEDEFDEEDGWLDEDEDEEEDEDELDEN